VWRGSDNRCLPLSRRVTVCHGKRRFWGLSICHFYWDFGKSVIAAKPA
jgi:hypothetical protein